MKMITNGAFRVMAFERSKVTSDGTTLGAYYAMAAESNERYLGDLETDHEGLESIREINPTVEYFIL